MSLKMNLPLIACAAFACATGPVFAANPLCPVSHICVSASERENQKLVLVDLTANTVTDIFMTPALPDSLLLDTQRRLIYSETIANQVRRYDPATNTDVLVAGPPQGIANPFDMILDPNGQLLYVSNFSGINGGDKITITNLAAALPNATTCPTPVIGPEGLAFDNLGNLFVLARNTPGMPGVAGIYRINKTTCAVLQSNAGFDPTNSLDGLAYDPSTNRLFATSNSGNSVYSIDPTTLAAVNIANGTIPQPDGIISDSHGLLYIASRTGFVYSATEAAVSTVTQLTPVPTIDDLGIVPAQPPVGLKTFTPKTVPVGGISTLTIQVTNPNPVTPLNDISFTDVLPAGVLVAAGPVVNGCGGTLTGATVGSNTVSLAPPPLNPLGAGASCTVSFSVIDNNVAGTASQNCVIVTSQNGGPGNQSCDTLTVVVGPALPPVITKSFNLTQIMVNGTSTLTVTVMNQNAFALSNVSFTDPLPGGVTVASPALTNTCGGTVTFAPGVAPFTSFALTGGAISAGPGTTCTLTFTVTGTTAGVKNNMTSTVTATDPRGILSTGVGASATLTVVGPPAIAKSFNPGSILVGGMSTLSFLITNPNPTVALTGVVFTDTLPAIVQVSATQVSPFAACGGTVTAPPLGSSIMLAGGALAAGGSCTFSVSVTGVSLGAQINTTSTVSSNEGGPGAPATAPIAVVAAPSSIDVFQIRYAANLDKGDSFVNLSNAGTLNGFAPAGNICANVYTFDPAEELISCCACLITPNGLNTLSVRNDLISNTLTPGKPTSVVIKLVASTPAPIVGTCNASTPSANPLNLVRGLRAWGTTLHALPTTPVTYGQTETPFSPVELSATELSKITTFCGFIQSIGSGFGICKSCQVGALGGETK